jgi:hypothetical protein
MGQSGPEQMQQKTLPDHLDGAGEQRSGNSKSAQ